MLLTWTSPLIAIALQKGTSIVYPILWRRQIQLCLNTVRKVECHLSQESSPTSSPWQATLGIISNQTTEAKHKNNQHSQRAPQQHPPRDRRTPFSFFLKLKNQQKRRHETSRGSGGERVANGGLQWHPHVDSWALTQWVRTDTRSHLVLYWQHCVKHCKAKGTHNFHTMGMHKRFIPNIYIQVALTAEDELFHNLICVPDCEVARDGMNHLCKIPS